ncbi:MAG: AsmA-like C-terminal region-containing protein [Bacteroidota bacterium]
MKKILLIIGGLLVLLLAAAFIIPIAFKDDIKAKIDQQIATSVNANVYFDADKFSLSLFRHFPNVTVSLQDFGVVGKYPFKGDTLVSVKDFEIVVNLMSVISGDQIKVNGIFLDSPRVLAKVLKDGSANWDIAIKDSTQAPVTDTTAAKFSIGIKEWEVKNGYIVYDDATMPMYTKIESLNHTGSGDFTQDIFEMASKTQIEKFTVAYGGTEYLTDKKLEADLTLEMNIPQLKFTFKQNTAKINDFALEFDGFFAMPDTNMVMDITYKTKETEFKHLLSLVPGVYTESFKDVEAKGTIAFDGLVKGTYNARQLPAFALNLLINNAMFKYPSLPTAVNNINVDMKIDNKDGVIDHTLIDIKKFNLDLGKNPINGRLLVQGLSKSTIDANVIAKINLAEITQMFPMEGLTLRGLYNLDLKAKGVYDTLTKQIPTINAKMRLQDGFVKSKDFPAPMEQMNVVAEIINLTGKMVDTKINVSDFRMKLEDEPLQASAYVENLDDYTYDVKVKGAADLTKMTKIYPLAGMTLTGRVVADITTKGKMSDVTAGRYDQLPTSGTMGMSNFTFTSKDVPQGVKITSAQMNFTPQQINLTEYKGFLGKSDVDMTGAISNYIGFMFGKDQTLKGNLNFKSNKFDVNEWMAEDPNAKPSPNDTVPLSVVEIPKNIDFVLASSIGQVIYTNMKMNNLKGNVIVRNGTVKMEQLAFNTLGGNFIVDGSYNPLDIKHPKFDFNLNIANLAIPAAFQTFNTVQKMMPLAQHMDGKVSTNFKVGGELGQDMMPNMATLAGGGVLKLAEAMIKDAPILQKLVAATKLNALSSMQLKDLLLQASISNGKIEYKPFDVNAGPYKLNIAGGSFLNGALDYKLIVDAPSGALGAAANQALASFTGGKSLVGDRIKIPIKVGGTYNAPNFVPLGGSSSGTTTVKEVVVANAKEAADKLKAEAEARFRAKTDSIRVANEAKLKAETDRVKADLEAKRKAAEDSLNKRLNSEKKKLLNQFGFPSKKDTTKKN